MSPNSPAAVALAHRLLAAATRAGPTTAATAVPVGTPMAIATQVLDDMAHTLARWFGPYGYHALLTRAVTRAQATHPALAAVRVGPPLTPVLDGLAEAAATHGEPSTSAGVAAVIAGVVDLLGRVIGDDMARSLLDPPGGFPGDATPDAPPSTSYEAESGNTGHARREAV